MKRRTGDPGQSVEDEINTVESNKRQRDENNYDDDDVFQLPADMETSESQATPGMDSNAETGDVAMETRGQKRAGSPEIYDEDPRKSGRGTDTLAFTAHWEADVAEKYSKPRVVPMAERMGLRGGSSMDIQTHDEFGRPSDFNKPEMRAHAIKTIEQEKPYLLIGSPMCSHWSII